MKASTSKIVVLSAIGCACVAYLALVAFASSDTDAPAHRHAFRARTQAPLVVALHQLSLTIEQRNSIRALFDQTKQQAIAEMQANRAHLQTLANPNDPGYAVAVQTAKTNAANRVQRRSDLYEHIYAVLTPQQQLELPAILAVEEAKIEQRIERRLQRGAPDSPG
jgi:Spy/CpxP family protein refolding chaperone